ncbi:helix-turn-helix transcriptional regulator [Rhizobium sp. YIM 134829]|uniref:helix-turn-helix transcriptional regulator n=1 Tax=Rhizobium sp. YIM 134829 TaxID=3390453 RepID=UPI0039788FD5
MSRTVRLFDLIGLLRARRLPVTALELARELGISERSIYRDIDTLRSLGALVEGEAGFGYSLRDGFFLPELAFSDDELDALVLGLGWVQQRGDPSLVKASGSALAKILAAKSRKTAENLDSPALVTAASASQRLDPPQTKALREAIRGQRKVAIRYEDGQSVRTDRIIWPIAIVYFDDVRVLAAWCEERTAFRHFRLDRITVATLLDERYPGRRHAIIKQWRQQDRDWRALLPVSDSPPR